jgi:hypothetical protein
MRSTQPVWMALRGIPKKRAELSSSAKVIPPACLIAWIPFAPSDPLPERIMAMTFDPLCSASEWKSVSTDGVVFRRIATP